jgi:hypothetical protein
MPKLSDRPFPDWIPGFNDPLVNVFRPDDAPVRFVQVVRLDNVVSWQVTNGAGSFWLMDPRAAERVEPDAGGGWKEGGQPPLRPVLMLHVKDLHPVVGLSVADSVGYLTYYLVVAGAEDGDPPLHLTPVDWEPTHWRELPKMPDRPWLAKLRPTGETP